MKTTWPRKWRPIVHRCYAFIWDTWREEKSRTEEELQSVSSWVLILKIRLSRRQIIPLIRGEFWPYFVSCASMDQSAKTCAIEIMRCFPPIFITLLFYKKSTDPTPKSETVFTIFYETLDLTPGSHTNFRRKSKFFVFLCVLQAPSPPPIIIAAATIPCDIIRAISLTTPPTEYNFVSWRSTKEQDDLPDCYYSLRGVMCVSVGRLAIQ